MRRRVGMLVVLCSAAAAAVLWLVQPGGAGVAGPSGKALRVAVVNVKQISDICERTQDLRKALEDERAAKAKAVRDLQEQGRRAQDDLKALTRGSAAWKAQSDKIDRLDIEARILSESSVKTLQQENVEYAMRVYDAIVKEVNAYATEKGIDIVLRTVETQGDSDMTAAEDVFRRMSQGVLYASQALDITDDIRKAVDKTYEAEKRGRP